MKHVAQRNERDQHPKKEQDASQEGEVGAWSHGRRLRLRERLVLSSRAVEGLRLEQLRPHVPATHDTHHFDFAEQEDEQPCQEQHVPGEDPEYNSREELWMLLHVFPQPFEARRHVPFVRYLVFCHKRW